MAYSRAGRMNLKSPRRQTAWVDGVEGSPTRTTDGAQLFSTALTSLTDGLTIVRVRGALVIDVTGTSGDTALLAFGLGVTTSQAVTAGAVPTPYTNMDWDGWLWHQFVPVRVTGSAASDVTSYRFEIDSRAMRKFPEGMELFGVFEMANETGVGVTANAQLYSRTLVKLA